MVGGPMWQRKQILQPMAPLLEGPDPELVMTTQSEDKQKESSSFWPVFRDWFRKKKLGSSTGENSSNSSSNRFASQYSHGGGGKDIRLLLGVLACPLAPIPLLLNNDSRQIELQPQLLTIKNIPGGLAARYIIQQYLAATGCLSGRNKNYKNMYSTGDVKMTSCETEISTTTSGDDEVKRLGTRSEDSGCFVLWMMSPAMWSLELVVGGSKVVAGSDGKIVWRHTPWLGTHAAKGPQRPLRRIIQSVDRGVN